MGRVRRKRREGEREMSDQANSGHVMIRGRTDQIGRKNQTHTAPVRS